MKSRYLNIVVIGGFLAFGLFSCKSSKKAADASSTEPTASKEEVATEKEPQSEPVSIPAVVSEKQRLTNKLESYFQAISSPNLSVASANNSIEEMKSMFAKADVPVLIIIHQGTDGNIDYDEPTTILNYMNYLKDQKKNLNKVEEFKTDSNGKITELILIRK